MRTLIFFVFAIVLAFAAQSDEVNRPSGLNCQLEAPPEKAGEIPNHGMTMRVYPRALDIDSKYIGCQLLWVQMVTQTTIVAIVAIENGYPTHLWSPNKSDDTLLACRYTNGKVTVGDPKKCAAPEDLLVKSFATGCIEKIRANVRNIGAGSPWPSGCELL